MVYVQLNWKLREETRALDAYVGDHVRDQLIILPPFTLCRLFTML